MVFDSITITLCIILFAKWTFNFLRVGFNFNRSVNLSVPSKEKLEKKNSYSNKMRGRQLNENKLPN